jgi:acyl carrier protein
MPLDELRAGVIAALREVAPEVDPARLACDRPLRRQVDLDSMDWLRVIVGWHERFGVDIPEADYGQLVSVDAVVAYLARHGGTGLTGITGPHAP